MALKPTTVKLTESEKAPVILVSTHYLYDPFAQVRFQAGVPTEVTEITSWMQSQIDAGLMAIQ